MKSFAGEERLKPVTYHSRIETSGLNVIQSKMAPDLATTNLPSSYRCYRVCLPRVAGSVVGRGGPRAPGPSPTVPRQTGAPKQGHFTRTRRQRWKLCLRSLRSLSLIDFNPSFKEEI